MKWSPPPVGTKLWRPDGLRLEVRGHVDGLAVLRWWRPGKQRWEYIVEGEIPFTVVGLYKTERPKLKRKETP